MAFTIVAKPRAWWPVTWSGVSEAGDIVENSIELRFHLLKVDAAAAFIRDVVAAQEREGEDGLDLADLYAALVERIADDWRGVHAENGDILPWTPAHLRLLMNEGRLFYHVFAAFRACLAAAPETRAGN